MRLVLTVLLAVGSYLTGFALGKGHEGTAMDDMVGVFVIILLMFVTRPKEVK